MYTANQTTYTTGTARRSSNTANDAPTGSAPYTSYTSQYPAQPPVMQPELLAYNGSYGYGGIHTPTGNDNSGYSAGNVNNAGPVYAPTSPWTTTHTGAGNSFRSAMNASMNSTGSTGSPAQQPLTQPEGQQGKKYRHNPYACSEPSSTPPASPLMSASHSSNFGDAHGYLPAAGQDAAAPIYDPSVLMNQDSMHHMGAGFMGGYGMPNHQNLGGAANNTGNFGMMNAGNVHNNNANPNSNLEEQFAAMVGSIAQTACTTRGRTTLLNIIRLQHLDKIQQIFDELCANFSVVIADPQGCHVLRFLVEYLQESHIDQLCTSMTPQLAYSMCTLSQHSRRVLQCLVEHHKTERIQPLIELICANGQAIAIARTQQGCIAIMRMLENVVAPLKDFIYRCIAPSFAELAVDQFGNYTVQTAIQTIDRVILSNTFEQVLGGRFVGVSCNKFGSNVMEKVIHCATPQLIRVLLDELCYQPQNLHKLINDGFGNFVVQGLVEATAGTPEGRRLCETIRPMLQNSPYGHKIEAKLRSKKLLSSVGTESNIRSNSTQGASSTASSSSTCGDQ